MPLEGLVACKLGKVEPQFFETAAQRLQVHHIGDTNCCSNVWVVQRINITKEYMGLNLLATKCGFTKSKRNFAIH